MKYNEWRDELKNNLLSCNESERQRVLDYYAEAYADRREAGFSEREIIEEFGAPYDAAHRILTETAKAEIEEEQTAPAPAPAPVVTPPPHTEQPNAAPVAPAFIPHPAPAAVKTKKSHTGLIIGLVCGFVALVILILAIVLPALAVNGLLNTDIEFTMENYTATEENTSLRVDFGAGSLKTEYYDGETISIDYPASKSFTQKITERNGKLTFKQSTKWYVWTIGTLDIPATVIHLPRDIVYNLDFDLGAGSIDIASGTYGTVMIDVGAGKLDFNDCECTSFKADVSAGKLTANNLKCSNFNAIVSAGKFESNNLVCDTLKSDVSAGKFEASSVQCPDIKTTVSAGSAQISIKGIKSEYTIRSSVSAGSCNLSNQTGTTDKLLVADCSAGSITVTFDN
ncbi:MAG: DUF4097 family beta strand repeat-containing protein [Clostridia bacterium]|nr:DUF4097 family beta strand repeat-containing protein [Clostridia bacterium]